MAIFQYGGKPLTVERLARVGKRTGRRLQFSARRLLGYDDIVATTAWGARIKLGYNNPSALSMFSGAYEPEEMTVLDQRIRPGMTVLDVGANVGYMTLFMAARVGDAGRVHSFEPNPTVARRLAENLALNPALRGRITVHDFALGATSRETEFYAPVDGHEGVGGLRDTERAPLDRVIRVPVRTLDEFAAAYGIRRLDFIKMDVEGGEWDVLKGGAGVLARFRPLILLEAFDGNTRAYGYRVFELLSDLEARGYEVTQAGLGFNFLAVPRAGVAAALADETGVEA